MYIESNGESGFPQRYLSGGMGQGAGMAHGGPGSTMVVQGQQIHTGEQASEYVQMMGPTPPAAPPMMMPSSTTMVSVDEAHRQKVAIGLTIAFALGVGFVIYKATR